MWVLVHIVVTLFALGDIRQVHEVIISLPILTVVLVVISESGSLNEDVIALMRGQVRIVVTQVRKQIVCSL